MTATLTRLPGSLWNDDVSKEPLRHGLSAFPTRAVAVTVRVDGRDEVRTPFSFGVEIPWEPARVPSLRNDPPARGRDCGRPGRSASPC